MVKFAVAVAMLFALTGCGATRHIGSVTAPIPQAAAVQGEATIAVAERAVRQQLEKQIPDYWVKLQALVVMAPASGDIYTFQAYQTVSGLAGAKRFKVDGTYDAQHQTVKVLHKVAI
ncbi:MAG: hypothetical protein JWM80_3610 [Cyanobacteria bacterium RYN_339]|nr:hypothetical protein [Cyanobacteria bacterium RYN_339]